MPLHNNWTSYGATDIGRVRRSNQDAYEALPHLGLFTVADGMGGHVGGETASRLAIESVIATFQDIVMTHESTQNSSSEELYVHRAFDQAQQQVLAHARANPSLQGMGTTLVIVHVILTPTPRAIVGHIGDSRAYLYRQDQLISLTRDHSLIEQYLEQGRIASWEADTHPQRHILTQAIGVEDPFNPTVTTYPLLPHDLILLCTDGLTKMLHETRISQILQQDGKDLEKTGKHLISESLEHGGADNVTVILYADLGNNNP